MKKVFLFLLIAIFVLGLVSSCSNNKEDFDFRKTKWGMKINEVIDIEAKSGNKKYKRESGAYEELIYENIDYKGLSIRLRYLFATESENKILAGAKFKEPILLIAHIQYLDDANQQLKDEIFKEFESETSGEFGGIGIEIGIQGDNLTIISPIEDTPAWNAGIKAGDRIVEVNGEATKGLSLVEAAQKMRGNIVCL